MGPFRETQLPVQLFETLDGTPLQQLPIQVCQHTGYMCVFWEDVQDAFYGVYFLNFKLLRRMQRVMFLVDQYGEV